MIYSAVGTLAAWNALSAPEQAFYNGGHYLTFESAILAISSTDDNELRDISDISLNQITFPATFNGKQIRIVGQGNWINCAGDGVDNIRLQGNYPILIKNNKFKLITAKTNGFKSIISNLSNTSVFELYNNLFDLSVGTGSVFAHGSPAASGTNKLKSNVVLSGTGAIAVSYGGFWTGSIDPVNILVENNFVWNAYNAFRNNSGVTGLVLKNNSFLSSYGGVQIPHLYTDQGGNATSDATGTVGYRNLVATNCMIDPVNGDFRPTRYLKGIGVEPTEGLEADDRNYLRSISPYCTGVRELAERVTNGFGNEDEFGESVFGDVESSGGLADYVEELKLALSLSI